uniref:Uncharacterized protein n=1 Tax=Rhizophora mucronata TaxID=61149 RepID=A0A2P2R207_RHIMU
MPNYADVRFFHHPSYFSMSLRLTLGGTPLLPPCAHRPSIFCLPTSIPQVITFVGHGRKKV